MAELRPSNPHRRVICRILGVFIWVEKLGGRGRKGPKRREKEKKFGQLDDGVNSEQDGSLSSKL